MIFARWGRYFLFIFLSPSISWSQSFVEPPTKLPEVSFVGPNINTDFFEMKLRASTYRERNEDRKNIFNGTQNVIINSPIHGDLIVDFGRLKTENEK